MVVMFSALLSEDGLPIRWEDGTLALLQDNTAKIFEVPPNYGYIDADGTNRGLSVEALATCIVPQGTLQVIPVAGDVAHPVFAGPS